LKTPGLANAFMNMNTLTTPENVDRFVFLKDDPDLAVVWEDVKNNGPAAMQKVRLRLMCYLALVDTEYIHVCVF